jgi:hypothetical protein
MPRCLPTRTAHSARSGICKRDDRCGAALAALAAVALLGAPATSRASQVTRCDALVEATGLDAAGGTVEVLIHEASPKCSDKIGTREKMPLQGAQVKVGQLLRAHYHFAFSTTMKVLVNTGWTLRAAADAVEVAEHRRLAALPTASREAVAAVIAAVQARAAAGGPLWEAVETLPERGFVDPCQGTLLWPDPKQAPPDKERCGRGAPRTFVLSRPDFSFTLSFNRALPARPTLADLKRHYREAVVEGFVPSPPRLPGWRFGGPRTGGGTFSRSHLGRTVRLESYADGRLRVILQIEAWSSMSAWQLNPKCEPRAACVVPVVHFKVPLRTHLAIDVPLATRVTK